MKTKGILTVVSGFAGTGKGTLMKRLIHDYDCYALSVSMTTRQPRPGERDGVDYFFVSREEFEKTIEEDGLIEHACYVDNYYGTPRKYIEEKLAEGKDVILEIEIQGALKVKERFPETLLIFVMPPSAEELKKRLTGRGTESLPVIAKRMCRAAEEACGIEKYDYIAINDNLDDCVSMLHRMISTAHMRTICNLEFIDQVRKDLTETWKGEN